MCGFSTIWPVLGVDLSFSQAFIWFWGYKVDLRKESVISGRFLPNNWDLECDCGCLVKSAASSLYLPPAPLVSEHSRIATTQMNDYDCRNEDPFESSQEKLLIYEDTVELDSKPKVGGTKAILGISNFSLLFHIFSLACPASFPYEPVSFSAF